MACARRAEALMHLPHVCMALSHTLGRMDGRTEGLCVCPPLCPHKHPPILAAERPVPQLQATPGRSSRFPVGRVPRVASESRRCRTPWSQGVRQETHTAPRGAQRKGHLPGDPSREGPAVATASATVWVRRQRGGHGELCLTPCRCRGEKRPLSAGCLPSQEVV